MPNSEPQPEKIGESRAYWIHKVGEPTGPVAQFRMAQLIDLDDRLYENARIVYRFLVGWYHDGYGDALLSMRHVSKVMRQRAPEGASVLSHSVVQRAVIALMETGWVVRTFKGRGKGKGASRYVPVLNVLELAAQGKFPQPSHSGGTVELSHSNGTRLFRANGTVDAELSNSNGPKTLLPDPATEPRTGKEEIDCSPPASGLSAAAAEQGGFEELYEAYGVRKEFAAARAAYEKLAPSAPLLAEMVEAATAWRLAAEGIERMHLARWIREERYREDPKSARKAKTAVEPVTEKPKPDFTVYPDKSVSATICRVEESTDEEDGAHLLTVWFRTPDGNEIDHLIVTESCDEKEQDSGQKELGELLNAACLDDLTDANDLVGRSVDLRVAHPGNKVVSMHQPFVRSASRPPVKFFPAMSPVDPHWHAIRAAAKDWAAKFDDDNEREAA